ncbi:protein bric-a-brac 1-like isoform X2 [Thrips palmi]|uniref:Protein bric-a-brac 1-like isoform X2 n=1 Tax=Thrips palmi TaxID=161013 RepID=A0A6P8ZWB7_THRPL|nr:protein bric-a-brac 1-like isoform X2 [Thrips palmi]
MTRSAADRIIVLNCPVFRETSPNAGTWKFFLFNVIMADQQFCLRWNNHQNTLISVFDTLLEGEILVDCTLAAEGKFLRAHKVVLSACSPFFSDLLRQHYEQHPILIMKDVKFEQLKAMLDYMYRGEVKISQDQLGTFLKAAESLQIKGLSDSTSNCESQPKQKTTGESNTLRTLSKADGDLTSSVSRSPTNRRKKRRHPSGSCDDVVSEENSNDRLCESNTPPPTKLSVESRMSKVPSPTVPQDNDSGAVNEATRNVPFQSLPVSTSVMYSKGGLPQQQPSSLIDTLVFEPKSEFIELDEDEDMNQDDSVAEAGPSHSQDDSGGYNWHVDRPEDSYLSQESPSGPRNAQGTSVREARFKLAHALRGLSDTLKNTENFPDASSPVMVNLADNIGKAVNKLNYSSVNPFHSTRTSHALPLSLLNSKIRKKGLRPKCSKPLKKLCEKNGVVPEVKADVSIHSNLDLTEKNKIWLIPKIELTDIVKSKVIKTEGN